MRSTNFSNVEEPSAFHGRQRDFRQDPDQRVWAGEALDRIAERVVLMALSGDKDAISEIDNRLDGRPGETIDATIDAGGGLLAVLAGISKGDDPSVA